MIPLRSRRLRRGESERALAHAAGVSRGALRAVERGAGNGRLGTLAAAAAALDMRVEMIGVGDEGASDCSTVAVSLRVVADGFRSWTQHFMNLVDEFRRTFDPRLLLLPPTAQLDPRLRALLAAIVCELCGEAVIDPPRWAGRPHFLPTPWFVAESESLKASALLESPLSFRRNNIFVLANFMERA